MNRLLFNSLIGLCCCLYLSSCSGDQTAVNLRLTHAENKEIEAKYSSYLDSIRPVWDSLCLANHDLMVSRALDSIVKERLEEEALLRSRPVSKSFPVKDLQ